MPSKTLSSLLLAEEKLHNLYLAKSSGEPFHPKYKKDKESFRKLIRADLKLERDMRKYFKGLTYRVHQYINWTNYNNQLIQASVKDWISADWSEENLQLKVILTDSLLSVIEAGGMSLEKELAIDLAWTSQNDFAMMFIDKYTYKLAGNLTGTTIDRLRESLKLSMSLREDQVTAALRLDKVIDDPRRAATIARTETTRAYATGRMAVGTQIGADRKQWNATLNACPICQELKGKIVPIDKEYAPGIFTTPGHPNCHCIDDLLMPESGSSTPGDPYELLDGLLN